MCDLHEYSDEASEYYGKKYGAYENWEIHLVYQDAENKPLTEKETRISKYIIKVMLEKEEEAFQNGIQLRLPDNLGIVQKYLEVENQITKRQFDYLKDHAERMEIKIPNSLDFLQGD